MTLVPYIPKKKISISTTLPKKYVVWHGSFSRTKYTPYGSTPVKATSIVDNWAESGEKQGAPYLVDRDGTIYKIFDDKDWTYHLNMPSEKGFYDKQAIPVSLANELNLIKENGQYYSFEYVHNTNLYSGPVTNCDWHSQNYWASLEESQVDAAIDITLDSCERHNIDPIFYIGKESGLDVLNKATVFSHSAIKKDANDFPPFQEWVISKIKSKGIKTVS